MHASVLNYAVASPVPALPVGASPFEPGPHTIRTEATATREDLLNACIDRVLATTPGAADDDVAVVTAAQAPGSSRPGNHDDYGRPAGRLHPALVGRDAAGRRRRRTLVSHACASGGLGLAIGASMIDAGVARRVLVVAAMAPRFIESAAFASAGALSPESFCRPFDSAADGTALGAFAGVFLLGRAGAADTPQIGGVGIRTLGSGAQSDRTSQVACMRAALGRSAHRIGLVSAHATGTTHGDRVELDAIDEAVTPESSEVVTTSCKGELGHSVHAAGLASAALALESMRRSTVSGTAHCTDPIDSSTTVLGHGEVIDAPDLTTALVNSFGFGGSSCSLVLHAP